MAEKTFYIRKFDFEIGYLIKSPCRDCQNRGDFPKCADDCKMLDRIQTILSEGMSCTRGFSSVESYALSHQGWKNR
ncbi:MAG TPA: hypothetical protein PKV75_12000 [Desulfobacterales bacterium]|nr:hypothetical protein [Desulfobacterales bacterium]